MKHIHIGIYTYIYCVCKATLETQAYRNRRHNVKNSLPHRRQHYRICVVNAEENSGAESFCFCLDQSRSELTQSTHHLEKCPSHLVEQHIVVIREISSSQQIIACVLGGTRQHRRI